MNVQNFKSILPDTQNLKTFPGYIIGTEFAYNYYIYKEEFDHVYALMTIAAKDEVSELVVARTMLNFPVESDGTKDDATSVTPVNNLLRTWLFHNVTAEQFGKIVVAAKLGLLSPKDAQAASSEFLTLSPYPADPSYTVVAEAKSGEQVIVRAPEYFA